MTDSRRFTRFLTTLLCFICAGSAQAQVTSHALIPNMADGTVSIVDTAGFGLAFPSPIAVGGSPNCTYITADGRFGYTTTVNGGQVVKIDMVTGNVVTSINFPTQVVCLAVSPDETTGYVTDMDQGVVHVVDLATDSDTGISINVGTSPHGLDLTPDGSKLYVANTGAGTVSVIDTATNTVTATVTVGANPLAVHVLRNGSTAFVANNADGTVTPIDVATDVAQSAITVSTGPGPMDESPDGLLLYIAGDTNGTIDVLTISNSNVSTTTVGTAITGVSLTRDGLQTWALDASTNVAMAFSNPALTPITNVSVGNFPATLRPFIGPNLIVYAGGTPLAIGSDTDLTNGGFGTAYVDFNGGTLQLTNDWTSTRTVSLLGASPGGVIDTNSHTATLSGGIKGEGTLEKAGAGTLVFTGIASHAGTNVFEGTFEVDYVHSPDITVSGGVMAGSGTVGNLTLYCSSDLAPGTAASTGILTATGAVALSQFGNFNVRLNGATAGTGYDKLVATGGVNLNGATLNVTLGFVPTAGTAFTIATNATGTFNGLAENALFQISGQTFRITYQGGSGSDVVLMRDDPPAMSTINNVTVAGSNPPVSQQVTFTAIDEFSIPNVTATSSNQTLVPNGSLVVGGVCTNKTLTFMPAMNQSGSTTITVTASDGYQTSQRTFLFTVTDGTPTLAPIPDQTIGVGQILAPLTLTVSDDLTSVAAMGLTASSSNQALLSNNNILITGGATRKLSAAPATHMTGQTTITVTATDGSGNSVQQSFLLTVSDLPPVIGGLGDHTISGGSVLGPINFTLSDDVTAVTALTVSATSSNSALLPNADIVLGGSGGTRTLTATPVFGATGSTTITVSASDGTNTATATFILTVTNTPVYFLAEGATSSFFDTDILIANPNNAAAPITLTFYKSDGTTVVQQRTLTATSRTTIKVKDIAGMEAASFATAVISTGNLPLVVERTMSWDSTGYGSHGEKASSGAATTWYFAEGSQGYFHTYFLLLNPHAAANVAHVAYLLDDGSTVNKDYALAATSRTTIDLATEDMLANRSFGATITFDLPGMAERAMYFGDSPVYSGGHDSAGVTAPATSWFLAEGATGSFFDTFVLVANPLDNAANVTMTYLPASGVPVSKQHTLAPHQRLTVNIATEDPSLESAAVATSVASDNPVIVERSQYWPHGNWYEAHNSAGETSPGLRWGLAEGRVGGTNHAQTYVLIANPGAQDANVTATFLRADGTTVVKTLTVAATSRVNIAVTGAGSDVPELADEAFGTIIESTQPVMVERSMYTDANGVTWAAGTNATASRLPN